MNFYLAVLIAAAVAFFGAAALANYQGISEQAVEAPYAAPPPSPAAPIDAPVDAGFDAQEQAGGEPCSNVLTNLPFELAKRIGLAWCSFSAYLHALINRWGLDPFNTVLATAIILGFLVVADQLNIHLSGSIAGYALLVAFFIVLVIVIGGA